MRHMLGVLLAAVMGAAMFFCAGWGISRIMALHAAGQGIGTAQGLPALGALLGTGLLLGILMAVPVVSPLSTGLPGIVLLAWSALLVVNALRAVQLIPLRDHAFAAGFASLLGTGVLALAGIMMVIPLFVPSRWRREYAEEEFSDMPTAIGLVP
jgi:hypothetical protein